MRKNDNCDITACHNATSVNCLRRLDYYLGLQSQNSFQPTIALKNYERVYRVCMKLKLNQRPFANQRQHFRHSISFFFALIGFFFLPVPLSMADDEEEPLVLPPMTVTWFGTRAIKCYTASCGVVASYSSDLLPEANEIMPGDVDDVLETFCDQHENLKPQGCDASNPPSSPGVDINWEANGCGSSWWHNVVAFAVMSGVPEWQGYYSGNVNAPFAGVDFEPSCNGHDQCYGYGGQGSLTRPQCDTQFQIETRDACSDSASNVGICNDMADFYYDAVDQYGNQAYSDARGEFACAVWAKEHADAGCDD